MLVLNKCENCKWFNNNFCYNKKISNVGIYNLATNNREYEYLCGIIGKHFESKEPNNELKNIYDENKEIFKQIGKHNLPRHIKKKMNK
jgi:hypothetical protein